MVRQKVKQTEMLMETPMHSAIGMGWLTVRLTDSHSVKPKPKGTETAKRKEMH